VEERKDAGGNDARRHGAWLLPHVLLFLRGREGGRCCCRRRRAAAGVATQEDARTYVLSLSTAAAAAACWRVLGMLFMRRLPTLA
jgi:hypothetical protein